MALTGASGAAYGVRLLEAMVGAGVPLDAIISAHGWRLLGHEMEIRGPQELNGRLGGASLRYFDDADRGAPPASGSARYAGMVICPCSMGTVAAIAHGTSRSLIERSADVTLKERRPLIVVPRETPLSVVHLENLLTLARLGAVVLPASPGFYGRQSRVPDLVDFVVARVLDHMGVEHSLGLRWAGEPEGET